jgi:hypothetical protein
VGQGVRLELETHSNLIGKSEMDPFQKLKAALVSNAAEMKKNPRGVNEEDPSAKPPGNKNTAAAVRNKMKSRKPAVLPLNKSAEWRKACADLSTKLADQLTDQLPSKPPKHEIDEINAVIAGVPEPYQRQLTVDALEYGQLGESIPLLNRLNWVEKQPTVKKAVASEPENSAAEVKTAEQKDDETWNKELYSFMSPIRPPVDEDE